MDPQPHATELQGLDGGTVDVKIRRLAGIVAEALWKLLRRLLSTRCFGQDLKYGPFVQFRSWGQDSKSKSCSCSVDWQLWGR